MSAADFTGCVLEDVTMLVAETYGCGYDRLSRAKGDMILTDDSDQQIAARHNLPVFILEDLRRLEIQAHKDFQVGDVVYCSYDTYRVENVLDDRNGQTGFVYLTLRRQLKRDGWAKRPICLTQGAGGDHAYHIAKEAAP